MKTDTLPRAPRVFTDALGQAHPVAGPAPRIVSLVPSITELVCDLDLGSALVGRTGFCVHPRDFLKQVPKLGGTKDVHLDKLRQQEPTHVIVNIDENRREVMEEITRWGVRVIVTHPCTPEDNRALYRLLGGIFDRETVAERLVSALDAALADAAALGAALPRERVLYLIWREPWMTVARSTYISACLARVGWDTVPGVIEPRYPAFDWGAPWQHEVERVFLSSEPYRFREPHLAEVAQHLGRPADLIDGEMVSWYGSRAVAGLRYLIELRRRLAGA
ncbi:helical backbone metal receptor [Zoogloea sp.]|uniref:helical backbone metal receptor n=1 Tax=Zoogloea sp. TaxID=49181 RepID=UPI0035ADB184